MQIPHKVSHIKTNHKEEYILIQWRTKGFEREKIYTLHNCDVNADLINPNPILEFVIPFEQRHRYSPYFHNFMPLLVYAIAIGMFRNKDKKKVRLSLDKMDAIFSRFLKDYNNGTFDSQVVAAPEIGKVIKGRIKNE